MTNTAPADNVKISCRNVWQLFGDGAHGFLKKHDYQPTFEQIAEAGIIGAVRDVSFDVLEREILIIMGLSGSGKSTMLRCITQLLKPTSGEVFFDGADITKVSRNELSELRRHKMGMVFQHFGLLPHRTVLENIAFPLEIQNIDRDTRIAKARELVEIVGLSGRESYFPRELSGGQQQRVGIGRSLSVEPDVWFLDEPFSALDPLIRREMQDEFMRLQTQLHKSIVFVTHDFDEAVRLGDRIAIMKDGLLVQIGTAEELVTEPADSYVKAFVENAPKAKLISVGKIMDPGHGGGGNVDPISSSAVLEDVAQRIMLSETDVPVANKQGEIVGSVNKEKLVKVLF
ncbi:MAG: quaternary amine ABC transporter ATP-binding protein [Gammaproteobacteria bacterium]